MIVVKMVFVGWRGQNIFLGGGLLPKPSPCLHTCLIVSASIHSTPHIAYRRRYISLHREPADCACSAYKFRLMATSKMAASRYNAGGLSVGPPLNVRSSGRPD